MLGPADVRALADRLVMTPDELKAIATHPLASLGAHTVISEDLSHGQQYDGVTVLNPFVV